MIAVVLMAMLIAGGAMIEPRHGAASGEIPSRPSMPTAIGVNLYGAQTFNRQQVFANLIAQSEWMSSSGKGWTEMPPAQLDRLGWVRSLAPGQTAPRPLVLPPLPARPTVVHCRYQGHGELGAGGAASVRDSAPGRLTIDLRPTGGRDDGAWIELLRTDPADPLRALDCRAEGVPPDQRYTPAFLDFLKGFRVIRFLDWQQVNDNRPAIWADRTLPDSSTQVGPGGVSVEDMVDLANATGIDPWFHIPWRADDVYIREFARLVHARLDPRRTVYVELGNEMWNGMFDAARQARSEGLALGLGGGDPAQAEAIRYARQHVRAMRIWTEVFTDRPGRLVRVCASQSVWPDLARIILSDQDTARWTDALATAPYIWLDLDKYGAHDLDRIFAAMPAAIDATLASAAQNRDIAAQYGKRYITYEGGQHLVTSDMALADAVQRDPRMGEVYARYLRLWQERFGDLLMLYASTAPIGSSGAWGLQEYAGQPASEAPKLQAVRRFLDGSRS